MQDLRLPLEQPTDTCSYSLTISPPYLPYSSSSLLFSQTSFPTSLQHAHTGTGKCRAWIRMAVNESSLESYIGVICQNSSLRESVHIHCTLCICYCITCIAVCALLSLCSQHYEVYAFIRDEDVAGPLQQLLAGLSQINFNM